MATDHRLPETRDDTTSSQSPAVVIAGSVGVGVVVDVAAIQGFLALSIAALALVAVAVGAFRAGLRPIVVFVAVALLTRPLVDLTAVERGSALSPTELFGAGVLLVLVGWLVVGAERPLERLLTPIPIGVGLLTVVYGLSTLGSTEPASGLAATSRLAAGFAMFVVIDNLLARGVVRARHVAYLLLGSALIPLLYPLLGFVGFDVFQDKDDVQALKSVFFLSNNFAYYLAPMLVLALAWALRARGWERILAWVFFAAAATELVMTATRGAWVAATVGILVAAWLLDRRAALAAVLVGLLVAIVVPPVSDRLASLGEDPDDSRAESSLDWRFGQWETLTDELSSLPVLGNGPGEALRSTGKEAHNDYLKSVFETGVIGLVAFLLFLLVILWATWSAWSKRRTHGGSGHGPEDWTLAAAAAVAVLVCVGMTGENLIDNVTFLWATLPIFAIANAQSPAVRRTPEEGIEQS